MAGIGVAAAAQALAGLYNSRPSGKPPDGEPMYWNDTFQEEVLTVTLERYIGDELGFPDLPTVIGTSGHVIPPRSAYKLPKDRLVATISKNEPPWDEIPRSTPTVTIYPTDGPAITTPAGVNGGFADTIAETGVYYQPGPPTNNKYKFVATITSGSGTIPREPTEQPERGISNTGKVPDAALVGPVPAPGSPQGTGKGAGKGKTGSQNVGATSTDESSNPGGTGQRQGTMKNGNLYEGDVNVTNNYDNRTETVNVDNSRQTTVNNYRRTTTNGGIEPEPNPRTEPTNETTRVYNNKTYESTDTSPDLDKIAEEVGRIEKKVGDLLERSEPNDLLDNLDDLLDLLVRIWDFLTVDRGGVTYSIAAPCEKDADGNPIMIEREIGAGEYGDATCDRLDAIADLLAFMMASKHRTCAPMAAQPTNNVTITAYEVMQE